MKECYQPWNILLKTPAIKVIQFQQYDTTAQIK